MRQIAGVQTKPRTQSHSGFRHGTFGWAARAVTLTGRFFERYRPTYTGILLYYSSASPPYPIGLPTAQPRWTGCCNPTSGVTNATPGATAAPLASRRRAIRDALPPVATGAPD